MVFINILILIMLITKAHQLYLNQKLVYKMEVSEFCKRRVLPSIFLARNSIDTNAFIMSFSQIELPFSCPISVRTESGNNIIMVIKPSLTADVMTHCKTKTPELLVHEMGETFGGYWGPIWKNVFEYKSVEPKLYTLKTTQSTTTAPVTVSQNTEPTETAEPKTESKISDYSEEESFITVDMPLVNVSGKFVELGDGKRNISIEDEDAIFDLNYNVTPDCSRPCPEERTCQYVWSQQRQGFPDDCFPSPPGGDYATSVIPIVQFSLKSHPGWRKEGDDGEPRFDLDIVEKYTADHRLTKPHYKSTRRLRFRTFSRRPTTKHRRQYFRKNSTKGKLQTLRFTSHKNTGYDFPTTKASKSLQNISRVYSWKTIEELINKMNLTASLQRGEVKQLSDKKDAILQEISDVKHNFSIYLEPNLSKYDSSKTSPSTRGVKINKLSTTKFNQPSTKYTTKRKAGNKVTNKSINQTTTVGYSPLKKLDSTPSEINNNYKGRTTTSIVSKEKDNVEPFRTQVVDKTLVNRESWENVVQAAPDMAILLNITNDEMEKHQIVTNNGTAYNRFRRKKREIHSVEISNARPHNATTKVPITSTLLSTFRMADIQELSQLVELQDDELYGRVALRFLRPYLGPVIYNICDFNLTSKQHHIHLINASRIVITVNNFTNLYGLTLILTTARTLLVGETGCPTSNIECQVAGARVCIDSISACDGVPNCGSYGKDQSSHIFFRSSMLDADIDIIKEETKPKTIYENPLLWIKWTKESVYDEDRLMCGASEGLQHNVYIAAFTLLAVLLTLLYSVHYWLRRCVPKVADAFFIYTYGTENVLLLDPIMRSPNDNFHVEPSSNLFFRSSMLDSDIGIMEEETKPNCWKRFMKILCCGLTGRKKLITRHSNTSENEETTDSNKKTKYSFTQLQIQNMGKARNSIQTNSIELMSIKKRVSQTICPLKSVDSILTLEEPLPEDYKDELGILKFLRTARKLSENSNSEYKLRTVDRPSMTLENRSEEIEINTTDYHLHTLEEPGPSGVNDKKEQLPKPEPSGQQTKKQAGRKHLRFGDNNTMIPASIMEVDEDEEETDEPLRSHYRYSTFLDTVMGKQKFFSVNEDDNESHKHFWGGSGKAKKPNRNKNTQ